jgi:hypothetical protein
MSDCTQEIKGWDLILWYIEHFNLSVTDAIKDMREHNQDMDFLSDGNAQDILCRLTLLYLQKRRHKHG